MYLGGGGATSKSKTYPTHRLDKSVSLNDLLLPVPVDHSIQTLKGTASHEVTYTFLLNTKPLDLVVYVEEQRVVTRRIVTWSHEERAWTR